MRRKVPLTVERLREVLRYDAETGDFVWLVDPKRGRKKAGTLAGVIGEHCGGYRLIMVEGILYYAQRLAWLYMTGEWPKDAIDHVDRDGANNRWASRGIHLGTFDTVAEASAAYQVAAKEYFGEFMPIEERASWQ